MVFPAVMYECESGTIKAEQWTIDAFKMCSWRRLLRVLDCKEIKPFNSKGNRSWIFIGRTDAKAEALILWPPDGKSQLIGKDPDAGKDWMQKETGHQRMRWLDSTTNWTDMNLSKLRETVKDREAWCTEVNGVTTSRTQLSNWTITTNHADTNKLYENTGFCSQGRCQARNGRWQAGKQKNATVLSYQNSASLFFFLLSITPSCYKFLMLVYNLCKWDHKIKSVFFY